MNRDVLIISTMQGADNCARVIEQLIGARVEIAPNRRAGLVALHGSEFGVIVVDQALAESDPDWADQIWVKAGLAMPLQINFALSGCARLGREIKAALIRRTGQEKIARRAVAAEMEDELKSGVTSLLLESELALQEPAMPASLEPKLRHLVELAGALCERLRGPADTRL